MAILRMTRAEYEAKYGEKPKFPSATKTPNLENGGFIPRAKAVIQKTGDNIYDAITGAGQYEGQSSIRRGTEAVAQAFSAPRKVAFEALPEPAREGLKKTGEFIGSGFKAVTDKIGDSPALQKWVMEHPEAAKTLEEIAGTLSSAGSISGDILMADQASKVLQKGAEVGAKVVEKVGKGVEKVGEKLYKSAYTPTTDEAKLIQSNQANVKFLKQELKKVAKGTKEYDELSTQLKEAQAAKPTVASDTALKRGIAGTEKQIGVQSNVEKLDLWKNEIEPALKGTKGQITKDELFKKAAERVAQEVEPSRKISMQRALESLQDDYKDFAPTDLLTANKIKTSLDKFTPPKIFKGQDVSSEVKMLKSDLADAIREKTYASIDDINIKAAYRDYSNLKQLENVGIKALTTAGKKGGFGNFWTTLYEEATTPIKTIGGKVLYKVGNKLEFIGDKGVKTLGQHLENIGALETLKKNLETTNKQAGFVRNPLVKDSSATIKKAEEAIKHGKSGMDFSDPEGHFIDWGVKKGEVFNPDGTFNLSTDVGKSAYMGRVDDVMHKLNMNMPGLGYTFRDALGLKNLTLQQIIDKGLDYLHKYGK